MLFQCSIDFSHMPCHHVGRWLWLARRVSLLNPLFQVREHALHLGFYLERVLTSQLLVQAEKQTLCKGSGKHCAKVCRQSQFSCAVGPLSSRTRDHTWLRVCSSGTTFVLRRQPSIVSLPSPHEKSSVEVPSRGVFFLFFFSGGQLRFVCCFYLPNGFHVVHCLDTPPRTSSKALSLGKETQGRHEGSSRQRGGSAGLWDQQVFHVRLPC